MTSRGYNETKQLIQNLQDQLDRLVEQLCELEQGKNEMDQEEYEECRMDTLEQFDDVRQSLNKFSSGEKSLIDEVGYMQLAIQAAISQAFKTPDIIKMFAKNETGSLRTKLQQIELDIRLNRIPLEDASQARVEILTALRKLDTPLSVEEEQFLRETATSEMENFQRVDSNSYT